MNRSSRGAWWLLVAALVCAAPMVARAEESTEPKASYSDGTLRKLGRGASNILTGPAELIRMPELVGRQDGYFAALTVGIVQGAWRTLLREVVGVFEVATFYWEVPRNFAPIMTPEFAWKHGDWVKE